MKTPREIIDEFGGPEGFLDYLLLTGDIDASCVELTALIASRMKLDDYEKAKAIMRRIMESADVMATQIMKLNKSLDKIGQDRTN